MSFAMIMQFICMHWFEIVCALSALAILITKIVKFVKLTPADKYKNVRVWLLYAVMEAEKEYGSGQGKIKLAKVYDMFAMKFPFIKLIISQETFQIMVDETLEDMRKILEQNQKALPEE